MWKYCQTAGICHTDKQRNGKKTKHIDKLQLLSRQLLFQHTIPARRYFSTSSTRAQDGNSCCGQEWSDWQTMKSLKLPHITVYWFLIQTSCKQCSPREPKTGHSGSVWQNYYGKVEKGMLYYFVDIQKGRGYYIPRQWKDSYICQAEHITPWTYLWVAALHWADNTAWLNLVH